MTMPSLRYSRSVLTPGLLVRHYTILATRRKRRILLYLTGFSLPILGRSPPRSPQVMNPTRMEQVRACTEADERMPQKSTDFYPKVIGGLVMMPIGAEERL
ncbi:MAG: DUF1015 family protein [Chloroflexi bacterium]|nr:DUF1015 family protein [Chloroflexota bacterium]